MRKLKSIGKFQKEGLQLENKQMSSVFGGAETYHFKDTMQGDKPDKERCSREDNPNLQTANNTGWHCLGTIMQ
jgi:hypothetical protein